MSRKATGGGRGPDEWCPKSEAMAELRDVIALSVDGLPSLCDDDDDGRGEALNVDADKHIENILVPEVNTSDAFVVEYLEDEHISGEQEAVSHESPEKSLVIPSGDDQGAIPGPSQILNGREKWENYSPAMLRKPTSEALKTRKKRQASRQVTTVESELKKKLLERDQEMMEELHRLEVQRKKVELETAHIGFKTNKMKLQTQQLRYQHMREEHAVRMKLLGVTNYQNPGNQNNSSGSEND